MNRALMLALATVLPASAAAAAPVAMTAMHTESATPSRSGFRVWPSSPTPGSWPRSTPRWPPRRATDIHGRADCLAQGQGGGREAGE
ncbi:MAG: hypothetical protein WDM81_04425 [Rhizomicrobium sp.]